jgi:chromate transporter
MGPPEPGDHAERPSVTTGQSSSLAELAGLFLRLGATWAALVDPLTVALAVVSGAVLLRSPVNSAWLVLAVGLIGLLRRAITGA